MGSLSTDAKEAAKRVAGTQIIKAAKNALLQTLRSKGFNNSRVEKVSNFLDSEVGTAIVSTAVGFGIGNFPSLKKNGNAQSLAKEFRVGGMAVLGNILSEHAFSDILPVFSSILDKLPSSSPASNRVRIAEDVENIDLETDSVTTSSHTKTNKLSTRSQE